MEERQQEENDTQGSNPAGWSDVELPIGVWVADCGEKAGEWNLNNETTKDDKKDWAEQWLEQSQVCPQDTEPGELKVKFCTPSTWIKVQT